MKSALAAAALAITMVAGSAVTSQAAVVVTSGTADAFGNFGGGNTTSASNTKFYSFLIPLLGSYSVTASVTTAPSSKVALSAFNFYDNMGDILGSVGTGNSKTFNIGAYTFPTSGTYYVGVTSSGKGGYSGNIAVSAVPLPTSVALFGAALAGVGIAGAARRKSRKPANANA